MQATIIVRAGQYIDEQIGRPNAHGTTETGPCIRLLLTRTHDRNTYMVAAAATAQKMLPQHTRCRVSYRSEMAATASIACTAERAAENDV